MLPTRKKSKVRHFPEMAKISWFQDSFYAVIIFLTASPAKQLMLTPRVTFDPFLYAMIKIRKTTSMSSEA